MSFISDYFAKVAERQEKLKKKRTEAQGEKGDLSPVDELRLTLENAFASAFAPQSVRNFFQGVGAEAEQEGDRLKEQASSALREKLPKGLADFFEIPSKETKAQPSATRKVNPFVPTADYGLQGAEPGEDTALRARLFDMGIDTSGFTADEVKILAQQLSPALAAEFGLGQFAPRTLDFGAALNPAPIPERSVENPFDGFSGAALSKAFMEASPDFEEMRGRARNTDEEKLTAVLSGLASGAAAGLRPGRGGAASVLAAAGGAGSQALQRLNEIEDEKLDRIGLLESRNVRESLRFDTELAAKAAAIDQYNIQIAMERDRINQENQQRAAALAAQIGMQEAQGPYGVTRYTPKPDGTVEVEHVPDYYAINRLIEEDRMRMALVDAELGKLDYVDMGSSKIYAKEIPQDKQLNFYIARNTLNGVWSNSQAIRQLALESLPEDQQDIYNIAMLENPDETQEILNKLTFDYIMSQKPELLLSDFLTSEERQSLFSVIQKGYLDNMGAIGGQ